MNKIQEQDEQDVQDELVEQEEQERCKISNKMLEMKCSEEKNIVFFQIFEFFSCQYWSQLSAL
jgi:hypothetical protein